MFQEIEKSEAEEILRQRQLGFSFVRWLPKETGVRPIVNLRGRASSKDQHTIPALSINQVLKATFAILTYEKQRQPDLLGASVFSPYGIYPKLKQFKMELLRDTPSGILPKLYFVKLDVQACFDSIEQTKLLKILHDVISENYMIRKHGQVKPIAGKVQRVYIKKAQSEDEHTDFVAYARDLSTTLKQTIFTDQVVYDFQSRTATLKLLEEHIKENIVKIGTRYYRQIVGIPQGSVLSTILCSFLFGDLERTQLNVLDDPKSLLLRCIDDYLYLTTSLEKAKCFLDVMNKGHPEYGCIISKEKTLTNFEHESIEAAYITKPTQKYFPWCGLLIDMSTLSVRVDYSRYRGNDMEYSITVHKGRRPGLVFIHKMLQSAKARSHVIYTDTDLNGSHTVHVNVYQNFIVSAMKMHHYLMAWGIDVGKNTKLLRDAIGHTARCAYSAMRQQYSSPNGRTCDLQKSSVIWLGMHAFYTVLSKKPAIYGTSTLLQYLQFQVSLSRNKQLRRRMRNVVKDGLLGVAALNF
jgi:telomerase reverse transcriptase